MECVSSAVKKKSALRIHDKAEHIEGASITPVG
jgi:hypothetical protein